MSHQNQILLWKGCTYRNQLQKESASIERVLHKLNIPFKTVEEKCCGYPFYLAGYPREMESLAQETARMMAPFSLVLTSCPACLKAFSEVYPKSLSVKLPRILHLTQFLSEKADEGVLSTNRLDPVDMKVMYHDPCELGRESGVYEEPRKLLSLIPGLRLYEQRFTRENSACCGGGGLLPAFSPSLSTMAAARKLTQEDKVPNDVHAVVTTCPQCILNMRRGLDMWVEDDALKNLEILDLAQILDRVLR